MHEGVWHRGWCWHCFLSRFTATIQVSIFNAFSYLWRCRLQIRTVTSFIEGSRPGLYFGINNWIVSDEVKSNNKLCLLDICFFRTKVSLYKVAQTQPWDFCWLHSFQKLCWKPWCLLLLCQNTHLTNATCALTVGYKFVNDRKNW